MPRYDYRCSACGTTYERREGFDAPSVQECPDCYGVARRLLTPPALVFKGSGWYVNDSRKGSADSDSSSAAAKSDGTSSATATETSSESKSETPAKPARETSTAAAAD